MSADAIARLRERVRGHVVKLSHVPETCELCAIRALLDAHAEALDALRGVASSPGYVDLAQIDRDRVRAVLAKSGRR